MNMRLEDREAIRDVITAYAHAIDRRRWEIMGRLFHDDAKFQFGEITGTWQQFVSQAREIIEPCIATQHRLGQIMFSFAGPTTCHTETYMAAMHTIPPAYPLPDIFPDKGRIYSAMIAGRYVDQFELRNNEWRIAMRTGLYDWREFREVEGTDLSQLPPGSCGYHDHRDPSIRAAGRWLG